MRPIDKVANTLKNSVLDVTLTTGMIFKDCVYVAGQFDKGITILDSNGIKCFCLRANMPRYQNNKRKYYNKFRWVLSCIRSGCLDLRKDKYFHHPFSTGGITCGFE